jgi:hypothetical protein
MGGLVVATSLVLPQHRATDGVEAEGRTRRFTSSTARHPGMLDC